MHWQNALRAPGIREFLGERHLENSPLPEALYVEMVSAAAKAAFGEKLHRVSDWMIHRHLPLEDSANAEIQFTLTVNTAGFGSFQIFSREGSKNNREPVSKSKWMPLVSGKIEAGQAEAKWLYELEWRRKPRVRKTPEAPARRSKPWLIFADRGGVGLALAESLETRGESCVLVFAGDSFQMQSDRRFSVAPGRSEDVQQLLEAVLGREDPSCRGMIYLWGLDAVSTNGMTVAGLKDSQSLISDGTLPLIYSLTHTESNPAPQLWLATRGAQDVEPGDGLSLSVAQAPLWGLGRVIALEHPEVWGGLVDLPSSGKTDLTEAEAAMALCDEILGSDGEDQVALRGSERYVLRLVRSRCAAVVSRPLVLSHDATYLITGGLGALGLSVADWLFNRGARHFILTSRTGLPERSEWRDVPGESEPGKRISAVRDLEERGAAVHVVKADVSDESQMSGLREVLRRLPPLRGIIHAAGVVTSRDLVDLSADEYHEILRSKVTGAWLLHQLAASMSTAAGLDFFVLFSSAASILGSRGLAHYAAANHSLDALAHYRAAHGLPALTVNWGWWLGGGMVTEEFAARFRGAGLRGIPPAQALSVLGYLLETGATQKVVADIDWTVLGTVIESKRNRPLLGQLATRSELSGTEGGTEKQSSRLAEQIRQATPIERQPLLEEFIRTQVAELLGFAASKSVDPKLGFFKMGMDSIMTVQLRTRLERILGCSLPPTVAFEFPNVQGLARFLTETVIQPKRPLSTTVFAPVVAPVFEENNGSAKVSREALSEEALADLLEKKLAGLR
jgi:NAD(P)-dependent dehydrogenase (short-subunit alcohol dehydrogenase family)/acyl carrier protein